MFQTKMNERIGWWWWWCQEMLGSTCAGSMTTDGLFAIHFIITDSFINVLYYHTMAPIIGNPGTF